MKLRKLELKDAPFMLEWMHDKSVVQDLRTNFLEKTLEDCENFVKSSWDDPKSKHFAITDTDDTYLGTVSLKNIKEQTAEFGITVRNCAMGKGIAKEAMQEVIHLAFEKLNLTKVYWCVSPDNKRAVRFYDKNQCKRVNPSELKMIEGYTQQQIMAYILNAKTKGN